MQWLLSFPISQRNHFAVHPELLALALQIIQLYSEDPFPGIYSLRVTDAT